MTLTSDIDILEGTEEVVKDETQTDERRNPFPGLPYLSDKQVAGRFENSILLTLLTIADNVKNPS
ncbi:hypothetical protein Tcan_01844 [Toxocara canis]|uniref:Uncharacterized protein n=1 Tax=Toxocara canis TaxID=6265 RepID=A0A0B2VM32_TOXCA|nr:hypothetical protein Tcan_01844 [Toxocara canis]